MPVAVLGDIRAAWSDSRHGDLHPFRGDGDAALVRLATGVVGPRAGDMSGPPGVYWLRQMHGTTVHLAAADSPSASGAGGPVREGDALVATSPLVCLAMLTADCPSIALGSSEGVFAAVHAGWRGLTAGVVEAAVDVMRVLGATTVAGALGPCIHAECYQFSDRDLDVVAARYGDGVRAETSSGKPALDLPATVGAALDRSGVRQVPGVDACTACSGPYFSHRARADTGRQALVVWSAAGDGRP